MNAAQQIFEHLNVFARIELELGGGGFRLATPSKKSRFRKGEDGKRKPGQFARGLTNWRNGKASKGRI